jgi:hypothetical protein
MPISAGETLAPEAARMVRRYEEPDRNLPPPLRCIPAGACDACGKFCMSLNQAGIPCYHCFKGTFVHRGALRFHWCPACRGLTPLCGVCDGRQVVAAPR